MKNNSTIQALSLAFLMAFTGSAFAQQHNQPKAQHEGKRVEKQPSSYSTKTYYFSKNKLSKAALRKKILKMPGVKRVDIDLRKSFITIVFDEYKIPRDQLKGHLTNWGTPGDFDKKPSRDTAPRGKHGNYEPNGSERSDNRTR
jgi:copper chaperone CopZ